MLDEGHNKFWGSFNTGLSHTSGGGGANILHSLRGGGGRCGKFYQVFRGVCTSFQTSRCICLSCIIIIILKVKLAR